VSGSGYTVNSIVRDIASPVNIKKDLVVISRFNWRDFSWNVSLYLAGGNAEELLWVALDDDVWICVSGKDRFILPSSRAFYQSMNYLDQHAVYVVIRDKTRFYIPYVAFSLALFLAAYVIYP
jgi:hypothetical protein